jgi:hypothetical protein
VRIVRRSTRQPTNAWRSGHCQRTVEPPRFVARDLLDAVQWILRTEGLPPAGPAGGGGGR